MLIVDDDATIRVFLEAMLTAKGFQTVAAASAEDADALLREFPHAPQVAVLDILLPRRKNGIQYADALLQRYPRMRPIFITGWPEEEALVADAHARGQVLLKPFTIEQLLRAIHMPVDPPEP